MLEILQAIFKLLLFSISTLLGSHIPICILNRDPPKHARYISSWMFHGYPKLDSYQTQGVLHCCSILHPYHSWWNKPDKLQTKLEIQVSSLPLSTARSWQPYLLIYSSLSPLHHIYIALSYAHIFPFSYRSLTCSLWLLVYLKLILH